VPAQQLDPSLRGGGRSRLLFRNFPACHCEEAAAAADEAIPESHLGIASLRS
jgi:hypothetical protein